MIVAGVLVRSAHALSFVWLGGFAGNSVRSAVQGVRANDTLADWLRRRPAKPMGSPRVGSKPSGVEFADLHCGAIAATPKGFELLHNVLITKLEFRDVLGIRRDSSVGKASG